MVSMVKFDHLIKNPECFYVKLLNHMEYVGYNPYNTLNILYPLIVLHENTNNKIFTLKEAMRQPEKIDFISAMEK